MKRRFVKAACLWAAASCVYAQVEVIDRPISSEPVSESESLEKPSNQAQVSANNAAEMFYQFQVMQQELLELRGLVEQQMNEIKKLKQQRLDDYVDLDRRIGVLSGGAAVSSPTVTSPSSAPSRPSSGQSNAAASTSSSSSASPASEIAHYKSATKLILMNKDYDAGIAKLKEHLQLYPNGRYAGNAQYWLGEVYLAKGELDSAKQWFETLLADYPVHAKASDAKYKLGTTYHQLGNDEQARTLLQEVSASSGSAATLASKYLQNNL